MRRSAYFFLSVAFVTAGCSNFRENFLNPANTEVTVRSEPVVQFSVGPGSKLVAPQGIVLHCIATREKGYRDAPGVDQCMYVAADVSRIELDVTRNQRDEVLSFLMHLSDHNCATFMARAFATKSGIEAAQGTFKDVMTGISAALAKHAPGPSSVLGITNLVFGSFVSNYDSNYYVNHTFSAMENAISAERARIRADISENKKHGLTTAVDSKDPNKTVPGYTLSDGLSDVAEYDQACSIARGIRKLSELSATENNKQENNVDRVEGRANAQANGTDAATKDAALAQAKLELDLKTKQQTLNDLEQRLNDQKADLEKEKAALAAKKKTARKN